MSLLSRQHPPLPTRAAMTPTVAAPISAAPRRACLARLSLWGPAALAAHALCVAALASALLSPKPAQAQGGPISTPASKISGAQRSGDPGMAEAERAAVDRRYDEAIARYDRVLAANPRNVQARFERAWALAQLGREDEALRAFSEIAQEFPELPEPHNNLALIYARRGDLKRAEAELLQALDSRPGFAIAYTNLGDVYRKLAEQAYQQALKHNPRDTRASSGLAALRGTDGKGAAAAPGNDRPRQAPARGVEDAGEAREAREAREAPPPLPRAPGPDRPDLD